MKKNNQYSIKNKKLFNNDSLSYSRFLSKSLMDRMHSLENLSTQQIRYYFQLYLNKKKESWIYRLLFILFSLFFFFITASIFFKTTNFAYYFYLGGYRYVKEIIMISCGLLGCFSLIIAYFIQPEKEALNFISHQLKNDFSHFLQENGLSPLEMFQYISASFQTNSLKT